MKEFESEQLGAIRRLLHEISQLCEHATLTGSLSGGAARTVGRYNAILTKLIEDGVVKEGLFAPLPDTAEYGEVGVEARMLASYVRIGEKDKERNQGPHDPGILMRLAPFVDSRDLSSLVREQMQRGVHLDMHILTSIAPFLGKDDLSMLLREHLNSGEGKGGRTERQERPDRPERPERPDRESPVGNPFPSDMGWPFNHTPPAEKTTSMTLDEALERLRQPDLSDEERDLLVRQVRELATE